MKKFFSSATALPLLLFVLAASLFAFTNRPAAVSFSFTAAVSGNVNSGTFTSTGVGGLSGQVVEEYTFNGKKTHSEVTFTYADGTITAKTHSDVVLTGATAATGTGTWLITKGSGAYEGLKGSGTLTFNVTGINTSAESISEEWEGTTR